MAGEDGKFKGRDPAYVYDKRFVLRVATIALVASLAVIVVLVVNFGYDLVEKERRDFGGFDPAKGPVTTFKIHDHPALSSIQIQNYNASLQYNVGGNMILKDDKLCRVTPPLIGKQCHDVTVEHVYNGTTRIYPED